MSRSSRKGFAWLLAVALIVPIRVWAADWPTWRFGALAFGDLYHVRSNHLPAADGDSGLFLRRGYLTLDSEFSERFFGRIRLELNQSGDYISDQLELDFKDFYLGATLGRHRALAGLSPTPTFDVIERHWGLRYVARTPMDLQGIASRSSGLAISGPLNRSGTLSYRAMLSVALDYGRETNENDRVMGAIGWSPNDAWTFDLYADAEGQDGQRDRTTYQLFAARRTDRVRWGIQYSNQDREQDAPLELASAFMVLKLGAQDSLYGRVDRLIEPSPKGNDIDYIPFDPSARATALFAGWERRFGQHFRMTPNAVVIRYDRNADGVRPETDVHLRLTLFVDFE